MTRYSVRPRAEIFVKGNRFLSFPKNMDKKKIYIYIIYIYILYIYIYKNASNKKKKHNNRKNIKEAVTYICSKENLVENTLTNSPK